MMIGRFLFFSLFLFSVRVFADNNQLSTELILQLQARYPGAEIRLKGDLSWVGETIPFSYEKVRFLSDNQKGQARFEVYGELDNKTVRAELLTGFHAYQDIWIAQRRIRPTEILKSEDFTRTQTDLASGKYSHFKGLLLDPNSDLDLLEARLTILEGMTPLSSMVMRIPDVRRGQDLQVRLRSGGLTLTTNGIAQEAAYFGDQLKVLGGSNKKLISGVLQKDGTLLVQL